MRDKLVLFPTSDDQVAIVLREQERLREHFLYHWLPPSLSRNIMDKLWMTDAAMNAGLLAPRTRLTREEENLEEEARGFHYPVIVKPVRSGDPRFPSGLKNYVAHSVEDLQRFYDNAPSTLGATIWQEAVDGGDHQIFQCNVLIQGDGALGGHVCVRKLRHNLPGYGVMCFGRSETNGTILNDSLKLLRWLDYRGLASLEFKWCARDERYYFIEMNPRLPWYNSLFVATGVNLAWLAYKALGGEKSAGVGAQRDSVHWLAFRQDFGHKLHAGLGSYQWLCSLARARSWAWWNLRDPLPFWHSNLDFIKFTFERALGVGKS
jgi:predicted ATP-grasp superfamily ATP-dependent carboligase